MRIVRAAVVIITCAGVAGCTGTVPRSGGGQPDIVVANRN